MSCLVLSALYSDSEKACVGTVTTGWLCVPVKQQLEDQLGPHICQFPLEIPMLQPWHLCCVGILARPVSSEGSKEQRCGISAGSEIGDDKLCLQRSITVGYPTASAAVEFRSQEQSKVFFSFNEYHVLSSYALTGLNSLSMALAGLHVPQGRRVQTVYPSHHHPLAAGM